VERYGRSGIEIADEKSLVKKGGVRPVRRDAGDRRHGRTADWRTADWRSAALLEPRELDQEVIQVE